jgi:hypothetical protein
MKGFQRRKSFLSIGKNRVNTNFVLHYLTIEETNCLPNGYKGELIQPPLARKVKIYTLNESFCIVIMDMKREKNIGREG